MRENLALGAEAYMTQTTLEIFKIQIENLCLATLEPVAPAIALWARQYTTATSMLMSQEWLGTSAVT